MRDMREYQGQLLRDAGSGQVTLSGVGHVIVPTSIIARELPRVLGELLDPDTTDILLYQIGFLTGRTHADAFFAERGVGEHELLYRALSGPFHFAWAGYGDVDILLLEAQRDQDFVALWETDNSFSAREGLAVGERRRTCHVQAGYSAGWLTAATRMPLEARELACQTESVQHCRFLVAHERLMPRRLSETRFHRTRGRYDVIPARAPGASSGADPAGGREHGPILRVL